MKKYKGHKSAGVSEYETGPDWIRIKFKDGTVYTYTYGSAGRIHIETMKDLAKKGKHLTTYINQYVRDQYAI